MVICGDCKGWVWVGNQNQCSIKRIVLDSKTVEERIEVECDKFELAPRDIRAKMREYVEVAITEVHSNGRVQIPADIRLDLEIVDGDKILWIRKASKEYTFRKVGAKPAFKPVYR